MDPIDLNETFFKGTVTEVGDIEIVNEFGFDEGRRMIELEKNDGTTLQLEQPVNLLNEDDNISVQKGDDLVLVETNLNGQVQINIQEPYRLDGILFLFGLFIVLAIGIAGKKGFYSILGLFLSFFLIIKWIIPQILAGQNPLLISFFGVVAIAAITFYLSHGLKKKTTLALSSTLITLVFAFLISLLAVSIMNLFGTGTEEAVSLNFGGLNAINLKGLLLGAIVIGTLGILDDVTITQVAAVKEIHKADNRLSAKELYKRGLEVGKDHIASIINTLVLAYSGAAFPVLIVLVTSARPFWVTINSEFLAEEIARTLVGSMTLILAIPIATLLAAGYYAKKN